MTPTNKTRTQCYVIWTTGAILAIVFHGRNGSGPIDAGIAHVKHVLKQARLLKRALLSPFEHMFNLTCVALEAYMSQTVMECMFVLLYVIV